MPAKWKLGDVASIAVDALDHVWVLHRPRTLPADQLALAAPPVLEFDSTGKFIQAWGGAGEGFDWPQREHGIAVDYKGMVWVGGNNDPRRKLPLLKPLFDDQVLKFTKDGKFVKQFGHTNQSTGDTDTVNFHEPADMFVYQKTNEVFVADGYGNHRVIVLDADTGKFKRMWGAFGSEPGHPAPPQADKSAGPLEFNTVHFINISKDGLVYVADRGNHRVQVFTLEGKYLNQVFIQPESKGLTARAVGFSTDPQQEFLFVGGQPEIFVLNRKTLEVLGSIVEPGDDYGGHQFALDSKGNIYTADNEKRRARKFVFKGITAGQSR